MWGVIVLVVATILLLAVIPDLYARHHRKREKRLNHRHKRRIEL